MNRQILTLAPLAAFLAACTTEKPFDTVLDTGAMDTADADDTAPAPRDAPEAETIAAIAWKPELLDGAGMSGAASRNGFWISDSADHAYRVPWNPTGDSVQEAADVTITSESCGIRVADMDGSTLVVGSEDPGTDSYELSRMDEPSRSGDLEDLTDLRVSLEASDTAQSWNNAAMLDADRDGSADDLVVVGRASHGKNAGVIAVELNAPASGDISASDMDLRDACEKRPGSDLTHGAMSMILDADGSVWVTCASFDRATGLAEHRSSPIGRANRLIEDVSGWSVAPDPRGGVWLGSEGSGELVYAQVDGSSQRFAMDGFPHFGASPVVVEVGDQIILAVGAMATFDAPASAVYLYDVTDTTDLDTLIPNRLEPEGDVLCLGGVNALVAKTDGVYVASSGWFLDTEQGCGVQMWKIAE